MKIIYVFEPIHMNINKQIDFGPNKVISTLVVLPSPKSKIYSFSFP